MRNTFLLLRFGVFLLESIKYEIFDTNGYIGASVYAFFFKSIDFQPIPNNSNPPLFCDNDGVGAFVVLDAF